VLGFATGGFFSLLIRAFRSNKQNKHSPQCKVSRVSKILYNSPGMTERSRPEPNAKLAKDRPNKKLAKNKDRPKKD